MDKKSNKYRNGLRASGVLALLALGFYLGQRLGAIESQAKLSEPERTYYVRSQPMAPSPAELAKAALAAHGLNEDALPQITAADLESPEKRAELDRKLGRATQYSVTSEARASFERETVDVSWAAPFERSVRDLFEDPELDAAELVAVECRSTMCRIEVAFDSRQTFEELIRVSGAHGPLVGARGVSDIEEHRVVAYVTPTNTRSPG